MGGKAEGGAANDDPRQQVAALPWRMAPLGLEVLLITSRGTKRWVIPKGWPMRGRSPHEAAQREAFEEAGVKGPVEPMPIGSYRYRKFAKNGSSVICSVDVFPMQVTEQKRTWPEKPQRSTRWTPAHEAAELVAEPELRALILGFGARVAA